jgi:pimeloyl-ACP methyl ester carboxylesterase
MDAGEVRHWNADVNGVSIHVAERGPEDGPAVLLIHGFPELWLSWRHQMAALAARGFRALAPDLRGYGDSSVPSDPAAYTIFHIVGDIVALLEHLQLTTVPPFFPAVLLFLTSRSWVTEPFGLCLRAPPSAIWMDP